MDGRAWPSWSATRRAESAASSRIVAAVLRNECEVIQASVSGFAYERSKGQKNCDDTDDRACLTKSLAANDICTVPWDGREPTS